MTTKNKLIFGHKPTRDFHFDSGITIRLFWNRDKKYWGSGMFFNRKDGSKVVLRGKSKASIKESLQKLRERRAAYISNLLKYGSGQPY